MFKKRNNDSEFICPECGKVHSNWPALGFSSPDNYEELSNEDKKSIAKIDSDFCVISYEDQTDRFIRVSLVQNVMNSKDNLHYGLWVSLSEKSFNDYKNNFNNTEHEVEYFGWLCNALPGYESTMSIPMTVVTQRGDQRPIIYPHKDHDHKFVKDFYSGISSHQAQKRVDQI